MTPVPVQEVIGRVAPASALRWQPLKRRGDRRPLGATAAGSSRAEWASALLRVVQVVNVDHFQPKIVAAPLYLIVEIGRGETVSASDHFRGLHYTTAEIFAGEEFPICLFCGGRSLVQRDISAFRADDDLLPLDGAHGDRVPDRRSDCALGPLSP